MLDFVDETFKARMLQAWTNAWLQRVKAEKFPTKPDMLWQKPGTESGTYTGVDQMLVEAKQALQRQERTPGKDRTLMREE